MLAVCTLEASSSRQDRAFSIMPVKTKDKIFTHRRLASQEEISDEAIRLFHLDIEELTTRQSNLTIKGGQKYINNCSLFENWFGCLICQEISIKLKENKLHIFTNLQEITREGCIILFDLNWSFKL